MKIYIQITFFTLSQSLGVIIMSFSYVPNFECVGENGRILGIVLTSTFSLLGIQLYIIYLES